eukprot:2120869-Lingulodinium_polyedra.AAC.1
MGVRAANSLPGGRALSGLRSRRTVRAIRFATAIRNHGRAQTMRIAQSKQCVTKTVGGTKRISLA